MLLFCSGSQFVNVLDLYCECQVQNQVHRVSATFINSTLIVCAGMCAKPSFVVPGNSINVKVLQGPFNSTQSAQMIVTSGDPNPNNSFADGYGLCVSNDCVAGQTYSFTVSVKDKLGYETASNLPLINVSCTCCSIFKDADKEERRSVQSFESK